MADKTNLAGQKLMAARDEFMEDGLRQRKNRLKKTLTKKRNLVHIGMYFIAPILLVFFLMMSRSRNS